MNDKISRADAGLRRGLRRRHSTLGLSLCLMALVIPAAAQVPYSTRYFRVDSGNNLLIAVGPNQWTDHNAGEIGRDNSLSRNPGNETPNSYADWTIGSDMTPGLPNPAPSVVVDWAIY